VAAAPIRVAGGGAGRGSVPQGAAAPFDAEKGGAGGNNSAD
jgi:hypothetical protein